MVKHILRKAKHSLGFTLIETLLVIGIIGVTAAIAIPSLISVHRTTQLKKHDDYAKAIYLAAQDNLNQMRASGELTLLTDAADGLEGIAADPQAQHVPGSDGTPVSISTKYQYSYSQMLPDAETKNPSYDLIVPGSVDNSIRNEHVIVEYNPKNGVVYSVFYFDDADILELYSDAEKNAIIRGGEGVTTKDRRKLGAGYYCAENTDGLEDSSFKVVHAASGIQFVNEQESYVSVRLPMKIKDQNITFLSDYTRYVNGLEVQLTVTGEHGGTFTKNYIADTAPSFEGSTATPIAFGYDSTTFTVFVNIPMDTLRNGEGFTQKAENQDTATASNLIAAGDNVTVTADVTFYPSPAGNGTSEDDPIVMIESSSLAGINPMFHALTRDPQATPEDTSPYILAISNGRHLQNLAYLMPAFAEKIETIVFTHPENAQVEAGSAPVVDWAETAEYYKSGDVRRTLKPIDFSGVSASTNPTVRKLLIDGNGVTIQNLTVNQATTGTYRNAGLFGKLSNVQIKNLHLENPNVSANTAEATGALAGTVENVIIQECTVANPDVTTAISGKGYVGGLVGHAMSATEMTDCETAARVNGKGGTNPYVGGLIGFVDSGSEYPTIIDDCHAVGATVESSEPAAINYTRHILGGLVGRAKSDAEFLGCSTNSETRVIGFQNAKCDMGGFVGHASDVQFGSDAHPCISNAKLESSAKSTTNDPIPDTNMGGFAGKSESCVYNHPSVTMPKLPEYAENAGGFAALLDGDTVNHLTVTIKGDDSVSRTTVTNFGGIASTCSRTTVNGAEVTINPNAHNVKTMAAGAFGKVSNSSKISGVEVELSGSISVARERAGFAVTVDRSSSITESYFYGHLGSGSAGFVRTNNGSITRCYANPIMNGGNTFVATNNGTVKNCFAWVRGNSNSHDIRNGCSYSYFGSYDSNRKCTSMILYETLSPNGSSYRSGNITDTAALADVWAVDLLNKGQGTKPWEKDTDSDYPYPSLKDFGYGFGYPTPAVRNDPYGLLYVETYEDGTTGELLVHFTSDGKPTIQSNSLKDREITGTVYYLCHRTEDGFGTVVSDRNSGNNFQQWIGRFKLNNINQLYSIYQLTENTVFKNGVTSRYPLYNNSGAYRIRTAEQFGRISGSSDTFYVEKDISITAPISDFDGTLIGVNHAVITTNDCSVAEMSGGTIQNIVAEGVKGNPLVEINGTEVTGVTHSTSTLIETTKIKWDGLSAYTEDAGTKTVTDVDVIDCYIGEDNAVDGKVYYYTISDELTYEQGKSTEFSAKARTFQNLVDDAGESGSVRTFYSKNGTYYTADVTITYTESDEENNISAKYTFGFGSDEVVLPADSLNNSVYDDITLYYVDSSALNVAKCCLLNCGDLGYLAAANDGLTTADDTNSLSALWIGNGSGTWTNVGDSTVTLTIKLSENSDKMLTITCSGADILTGSFTATECSPYYACEYQGMNYIMFIPA